MELLDQTNTLEQLLGSIEGKKISIVTAFACGTENLIQQLLDNNNQLELIIGTINAFSSPKLIDFCSECDSENISTFVDFRYQNSIHWKLYLVEPDLVIIGSANFTTIGIKLTRDTCVVIHNKELFDNYATKITELKANRGVLKVEDSSNFNKAFNKYRLMHDRSQAGMVRTKQYETLRQWLEDETNQSIPLIIWLRNFNKKEKEESAAQLKILTEKLKILAEKKGDYERNNTTFILQHTYKCDENKLPYKTGDVVLSIKKDGSQPEFLTFDLFIYSKKMKTYFIYQIKNRRTSPPFKLDKSLITTIKENFGNFYNPKEEQRLLDRSFLESLIA